MMRRRAALAATVISSAASADILNVPGQFPTIQGAINFAQSGDEVVLAPGVYQEQIDLLGKRITVRGSQPNDLGVVNATVLDAGLGAPAILCANGETTGTVLEGFSVINGEGGIDFAGALEIRNANPTVRSMVFRDNNATDLFDNIERDASVAVRMGGDPRFIGCTFRDNTSRGGSASLRVSNGSTVVVASCFFIDNSCFGIGASPGIRSDTGSSVTVRDSLFFSNFCGFAPIVSFQSGVSNALIVERCVFDSNRSNSTSGINFSGDRPTRITDCVFTGNSGGNGGGALSFSFATDAVISGCEFVGNSSDSNGGAISSNFSTPVIEGCLFEQNESDAFYAALTFEACHPLVERCVFRANQPDAIEFSDDGFGSVGVFINSLFVDQPGRAVELTRDSVSEFYNCTFANNPSGAFILRQDSRATLFNSIVVDCGDNPVLDVGADTHELMSCLVDFEAPGVDNFTGPPSFVDEGAGDYRLTGLSAAVNAGDNSAIPAGVSTDADGNPRVFGGVVDAGAYELQEVPVSCQGDCDNSGAVDFNDLVSMLFEFGNAGDARCDADESGTVDFNDLVAALFLFGPCP